MRYNKIETRLFIHNRRKLAAHLQPNSLVVLNANDRMPKNADGVMLFCQNSDLFYLSGIEQQETILILYPDAKEAQWKELLFLKKTNAHSMVWEGQQYTKEVAYAISGIEQIHWLDAFESIFHTLMGQVGAVYLNTNEHPRATVTVQTRDARFIQWCKHRYPLHTYLRLAPIIHSLRAIKSTLELSLIKTACAITAKGFSKVLSLVQPGMMEYEIEAILAYEFIRHRSRGFAYNPIIASGENACILHYETNNQPCKAGTTVLLDIGAEYANYKADCTRVIPVSGRFTQRQRAVYNAVRCVMHQAKQLLIPGNDLPTYQQQVGELMTQALLGLGLLKLTDIRKQNPQYPAYKKYFMHGISHHLGLETHDVGEIYSKLVPNMVLTVEPGIYIREEGLGMRLENVVVIQDDGVEDLMDTIPLEAEEIETLMHTK